MLAEPGRSVVHLVVAVPAARAGHGSPLYAANGQYLGVGFRADSPTDTLVIGEHPRA
jgi:hypothetical protein